MAANQHDIKTALSLLGVDRLALAIHDQSFPNLPDEEVGRGTPYSKASKALLEYVSQLGFNTIKLGPQGKTSLVNPSPYDSTLFSKNDLSTHLPSLANDAVWEKLLDASFVASLVEKCPDAKVTRTKQSYTYAWAATHEGLKEAHRAFVERGSKEMHEAYSKWANDNAAWLDRDVLFELLAVDNGTDDWHGWDELDRNLAHAQISDLKAERRVKRLREEHKDDLDFFKFCQFVVHKQHQEFRAYAKSLGLRLYADLQIGFSQRDAWGLRHLFLPGYYLGAPPSRTNPDGQPWGYPIFDPNYYFARNAQGQAVPGEAMRCLLSRVDKLMMDFDGLRVDHPHGLVCPWVYKSSELDPVRSVQNGARLFDSPNVLQHPHLSAYAIARREQLSDESEVPRYADNWVTDLDDEQVSEYATLLEAIKQRVISHGREPADVMCEVLSSCPYPLQRVLSKYGYGRFRVTQKAQLANPDDTYRSDKAQPEDWIMVGTHDTKPLWLVVDEWTDEQKAAWAQYLAGRLSATESERAEMEKQLRTDKLKLVEAMFADLFIGPARNISIFFADLFGIREIYNRPGVSSDENWLVGLTSDFKQDYEHKVERGEALNLPRALAIALKAKLPNDSEAQALAKRLQGS